VTLRVDAARELLAPPEDVWAFLAEPYNLADWWPGIVGLRPDSRGLAPGARWHIVGDNRPTVFPGFSLRKPNMTGTLLVTAVEPGRRLAFHLAGEHIDVELTLEPRGHDHTLAVLTVDGPRLIGLRRTLPQRALARLYALCQTAADE
jgi:uncharacterized protein YndB with AHSA1/START domain